MARIIGATDAEIQEAVHFAKSSSGWSTYVNGMQIDYDQFKKKFISHVMLSRKKQFVRQLNLLGRNRFFSSLKSLTLA
jgi:hypothetical protein